MNVTKQGLMEHKPGSRASETLALSAPNQTHFVLLLMAWIHTLSLGILQKDRAGSPQECCW